MELEKQSLITPLRKAQENSFHLKMRKWDDYSQISYKERE